MPHRLHLTILLAIIAVFSTCSKTFACQGPVDPLGYRLTISLFRYYGVTDGEPKTYFSRFKGILQDKLSILAEEIDTRQPDFAYIKGLRLVPDREEALDDVLGSEDDADKYWNLSRSLMLLRGTMFPAQQVGYYVRSRIHIGDLHGYLPNRSISVELPVRDESFPNTADSHSVITFYTLAMDAARLQCEPAIVIALLSKAQDKLRDLRNRQGLNPDLIRLESAVSQAIEVEHRRASKP